MQQKKKKGKKKSLFEEIYFKHLLISSYSKPFIITFRRLLTRVNMQLSVTFQDTGFPDVVFTASEESLVKDALQVAADKANSLLIIPHSVAIQSSTLILILFF